MSMPKITKDVIVHVNGEGYVGKCKIDAWPTLSRDTEEYQAGGMPYKVKIDTGGAPLTLELTFSEYVGNILERYGVPILGSEGFRLNGVRQSPTTGKEEAFEINARGNFEEMNMGGFEPKKLDEFKIKANLTYYELIINGVQIVEIDTLNYIEKSGGIDRLEQRRKLLKM